MLFLVLLGVSILSFAFSSISNTDLAEILARRQGGTPTPELVESIRIEFGLNKSIVERYGIWLSNVIRGDLGISYMTRSPVWDNMKLYLPKTVVLSGLSFLLTIICTLPLGLLCARYRDGLFDSIMRAVTVLGICLPVFWLGFLLLLAFAVKVPIFSVAATSGIKGYILPSIALSLPMICTGIRIFRTGLLKELSSDYGTYLRSRGFSKGYILCRHAFRNALPPMVTWFASYAGYLIAGSAVVEKVFSIKGLGTHLIDAVIARDIPTISASVLIVAMVFVVFNLVADGVNLMICPRTIGGTDD